MKKIISLLLVLIMLFGVMPIQLFAAPWHTPPNPSAQPTLSTPVHGEPGPILTVNSSNGNLRNFNIRWQRPTLSTTPFGSGMSAGQLDGSIPIGGSPILEWTQYPTAYDIQFRNATTNEQWNQSVMPHRHEIPAGQGQGPNPMEVRAENIQRNMRSSSLYQIQILPYNLVPRRVVTQLPGGGISESIEYVVAPIDTSFPGGQRDIIYLTDVEIDMTKTRGHGNSITVEWFNPTFNGLNIFDEWRITVAEHNPSTPNRPIAENWVTQRTIPISEIDVLPGGRLRYTISSEDIYPMSMYNVSVEPKRNGRFVRLVTTVGESTPREPFTMPDGRLYNFASSDPATVEFRTTNPILLMPELHLEVLGADLISLWWSRFDGVAGEIEKLVIEEWNPQIMTMENPFDDLGLRRREIGIIQGEREIAETNDLTLGPNWPRDVRAYTLAVYVKGASDPAIRTNPVLYDPTYVDFAPYRPEIINVGARVVNNAVGLIDPFQFQAFTRAPYVLEEEPLVNQPPHSDYNPAGTRTPRIIDMHVHYEIYVADSWETLEMITDPILLLDPAQLNLVPYQSPLNVSGSAVDPSWQLPSPITEYYRRTDTGIERRLLDGNSVYYIKIRAIRNNPGNQSSLWAYGTVFMPPFGNIPTIPEMISAPPLHVERETSTAIDIRWPLRYLEIADERRILPDGSERERDVWNAMVGVAPNGELVFGRSAMQIENALDDELRYTVLNDLLIPRDRNSLLGEGQTPLDITSPARVGEFIQGPARAAVNGFLTGLRANLPPQGIPPLRIQDMVGKQYEIHVVEYEHMMRFGTDNAAHDDELPYDVYMDMLLNGQQSQNMWQRIDPTIAGGEGAFSVTSAHAPVSGPLKPNTSYVVFIRTYEMTVEGLKVSYYPTFVLGNTITEFDPVFPDPTTPVLFPVPEFITDHSIGVRWRVQDDMGFALYLSERMSDHPAGGVLLPPPLTTRQEIEDALKDPDIPFEIRNVTVGGEEIPFYFLRINGLFPDTLYYVWAYAFGLDAEGNIATDPSQPSNPVDMRTLDISPPRPPSIAPAPESLLNIYNRLNDAELSAYEPNALNILLNRIFDDFENDPIRPDSGTAEGGTAVPIGLPPDLYSRLHIIRFEELIANRTYFVRARTVLTVERTGGLGSPVQRTYSYEIQVSDDDEFLDAITFTIPPLPSVNLNGTNARRAYSEWVTIEIDTGSSDDEYDGVHSPDQYPLPERDWELTYDRETQTLKWRFRTDRIGEDGRPDQNVDQRFISRLIDERIFEYTIDVSQYEDYPITNRTVEIPESIIRAFDEHRVTLNINTGDFTYSIPPGTFDTAAVRALQNHPRSYYTINMSGNPNNMPELLPNTSFATIPQRFFVTVNTNDANDRRITMDTFAQPINVTLNMSDRVTPVGPNTGLFQSGNGVNGWQDMSGQFNNAAGTVTAQIQRPATFAGITRNSPVSQTPSASDVAMQRVTSRINFTDLTSYDPTREVTANELNNIVSAIINGNTTVTLGANVPASTMQSLERARLNAPQNLTREASIDIMVRLYESRTRQILTPMTPINSIPGAQNVNPAFEASIRKAADLGFITGPLEPNGALTMGELMIMLDILIQDTGM